ncbi:MAG: hypothetical protein EZS28_040550 [Streblomastix strix]|uniref:Uncharacterized protein n=1 Tax=Streblomastix strix TaxID=222440 RepID=A0A5J4U105_9EUKA|nr:MAG: hypothetical protein EZS28_040550 [Streblomastix strix]
MKIMKEGICPLIHLNCPTDLNCQQRINIPQSPALIELKSAVFQTLNDASEDISEFKDTLVNDHSIIPHLTHLLIQFASQSQLDKKTDSQEQHNQQQSESSSSISFISSYINLLYYLILYNYNNNNNNICNVVINTPNALHSLCTLTSYKINIHFNQENDKQTFEVRSSSGEFLYSIQSCGDASTQTELVNARYAGALVIAISTAGGAGEENDWGICDRLRYISQFLSSLNKGRINDYSSFPPQPLLARRSNEQIEEEGGNEEIESQISNKGLRGNMRNIASKVKGEILNYFIEQGNPRPSWY